MTASRSEICVQAGSRLHFGMFSFGHSDLPAFGGVGVMVAEPMLELRVRVAEQFRATGPLADRVTEAVKRLQAAWQWTALPDCEISVVQMPPQHFGLGSGTQLALAVGRALEFWCARPAVEIAQLAREVGRGTRSSVGTYGFDQGGLIVEAGHRGEGTSPLLGRWNLPDGWRWVLITLPSAPGLSGAAERSAFAKLPAVPRAVTEQLQAEVQSQLIPALERNDFDDVSASLFRFGEQTGSCFAAIQGGTFASATIAELVATLRSWGYQGVGQSSWGPTVFALVEDAARADELVARLRAVHGDDVAIRVTATLNAGARVASI